MLIGRALPCSHSGMALLGFPHDRVAQHADVADLDFNRIACVHRSHAFTGASVDHVTRVQCHMLADKTDARSAWQKSACLSLSAA